LQRQPGTQASPEQRDWPQPCSSTVQQVPESIRRLRSICQAGQRSATATAAAWKVRSSSTPMCCACPHVVTVDGAACFVALHACCCMPHSFPTRSSKCSCMPPSALACSAGAALLAAAPLPRLGVQHQRCAPTLHTPHHLLLRPPCLSLLPAALCLCLYTTPQLTVFSLPPPPPGPTL
jgi:hypothetical protein